jgi:hypothetical protein
MDEFTDERADLLNAVYKLAYQIEQTKLNQSSWRCRAFPCDPQNFLQDCNLTARRLWYGLAP